MRPNQHPRVIIRHCDSYDPARIRKIVREGLEELGLRPRGRTLLKPNIVASGPMFEHAHTRPEFVEGVLGALQDRAAEAGAPHVSELAVGERCGITLPSRMAFEGANYNPMLERMKVKRYLFEEESQVEIPLTHKERLRDYLFTPEPIAKADFFVNCPKFKAHPWTTVTFSLKNYIGIQDDRHRLIDHDHRLNEKIADLQYIIQPEFIAIDAIIAGEGRMLTPIPFPMNLIIMGDNQVAFDSVCCNIINIDPATVEHIRFSSERGFGPMDLGKIKITGDVTFEEARERGKIFRSGLIRVEKYFEGSNITAYAGTPPEPERTEYCWGGCPGAIEEAIEILRLYDKECDAKMPRLHIVFGNYQGGIDAKLGEKVIFVGDCSSWQGELPRARGGTELVQIRSTYKDRSTKDPMTAKHDDIYAKMMTVMGKLRSSKESPWVRFEGCPVSVAEQVLFLVNLGKLKNPYFERGQIVQFNKAYLQWKSVVAWRRLNGNPYNKTGPYVRGDAAPVVEPPA